LSRTNEEIAEKIDSIVYDSGVDFARWFTNMRKWLDRASARQEFE
jgi:hypothetical protein